MKLQTDFNLKSATNGNLQFAILESQFLSNQNDKYIRQGWLPFMDHDHPANPVGRVTVHTLSHLGTGDIDIESLRVEGRRYILYPLDRFLNIFHNFIIPGNENHLSRAKMMELTRFPTPSILTSSPFRVMALTLLRKRSEVICDFPDLKDYSLLKGQVSNGCRAVFPCASSFSKIPNSRMVTEPADPHPLLWSDMFPNLLYRFLFFRHRWP